MKQLDLTNSDESFRNRFWSKVDIRGEDECWPWRAWRDDGGYGHFGMGRRSGGHTGAHRVALALKIGVLSRCALHTCDNPPCCNPAHLFEGTNADNVADRDAKGRGVNPNGERHGATSLTVADVLDMRSRFDQGESAASVARGYGLPYTTVYSIVKRINWQHLAPSPIVR